MRAHSEHLLQWSSPLEHPVGVSTQSCLIRPAPTCQCAEMQIAWQGSFGGFPMNDGDAQGDDMETWKWRGAGEGVV